MCLCLCVRAHGACTCVVRTRVAVRACLHVGRYQATASRRSIWPQPLVSASALARTLALARSCWNSNAHMCASTHSRTNGTRECAQTHERACGGALTQIGHTDTRTHRARGGGVSLVGKRRRCSAARPRWEHAHAAGRARQVSGHDAHSDGAPGASSGTPVSWASRVLCSLPRQLHLPPQRPPLASAC